MNKAERLPAFMTAQVIEFPHAEEMTESERKIECRQKKLTNLIEGFGNATFGVFLTEKAAVREAIEELMVKESALQWIVRVAKRSTGKVREGLWADIDRALTELEETAGSVIRAAEYWAHSDLNRRRERVSSPERF